MTVDDAAVERVAEADRRTVAIVEALVSELRDQWEENHFEHCSREWPHPEGKYCHWPYPDILARFDAGRLGVLPVDPAADRGAFDAWLASRVMVTAPWAGRDFAWDAWQAALRYARAARTEGM